MDSCETCRFWRTYGGAARNGECRYDPPRLVGVGADEWEIKTMFPVTNAAIWCGKHELTDQLLFQDRGAEATASGRPDSCFPGA